MPLMRADPNFYSVQASFTTTSTGPGNVLELGFPATALRVVNSCNGDVWARFDGNVPTTADLRIRACSELAWAGLPPFSYVGLYTTNTAHVVNVSALGG